jgi:hypothetical protein
LTTIALLLGACPAGDDSDTNASDTDPTGGTEPSTMTDPSTTMSGTMTDPATTDSTMTDPATTDSTMTDPATTDSTMTDPATTDPDSSGTDPTDTTETGTDTEPGTETGAGECPPEKDDDECALCTKENCCPELMACQANKDCDCVVQCVSEMGIGQQQACLDMCGVEEPPAEATTLQTCVATSGCLQACL